MKRALCLIFFASGAAALVFETLWFRQAGLALGNSVWASSLVLAGFMGGLAIGNLLVARIGDRLGNPVRAYAYFEAAIGLTGVGLVVGLPQVGAWLAAWMGPIIDHAWVVNPVRLLIAFVLLLVPSTAMGATLPLLTKQLTESPGDFGRALGRLYGWNTLGAVFGVVAAEGFLIGALGVRGAAFAAGTVNLAVAIIALALSRRLELSRAIRSDIGSHTRPDRAVAATPLLAGWQRSARWLAAAFVAGFLLLALEVVWFRFLALYIAGHSLDLAVVLATVLAGIGLGGFAASAWLRRNPDASSSAATVALLAGTACAATYATFPWAAGSLGLSLVSDPMSIMRLGLPLMLPVSFLSGVFFTLLAAGLRATLPTEISTAGTLTFVNTTGAAIGSLAGGFVLLPLLGMEASLFVLALAYAIVAVLVWPRPTTRNGMRLAAVVALALAAALFPFGAMQSNHLQAPIHRWMTSQQTDVALVREGLTETIIYLDHKVLDTHHSYRLVTNGYSMSATDSRSRRYMKLYVYLPVAVHPEPRKALLISFGVGSTARALADTRSLESIDIVDISRDILDASRVVFPAPRDNPLFDPRVRVHVEDGRYFLQTTDQAFDLITAEPPPPRLAGVVNLYTREYFQLMHDRLAAGGIATYWLPLHSLTEASGKSILRAFGDVFEDCTLWNGAGLNLMMVGTRRCAGTDSSDHFAAQWRDPVVGPEMRELGLERPEQLGALFIGGPEFIDTLTRNVLPLVDDHPMRVMARGDFAGRTPPEYARWQDVGDAAERFAASPVIERLFPQPVREATLTWFRYQHLINRTLFSSGIHLDGEISDLHAVLSETDLRSPVLWGLDSEADLQRVAAEVGPSGLDDPRLQYHRGVGHLAQRRYAAAVEPLRLAEAEPKLRRDAFRLAVYAMCRAGQVVEAQRLVRARYAQSGGPDPLPPFWTWMNATFSIDPTTERVTLSEP